ncbi:MAG: type II secretion system protein [Candidatus Nitronauta litoralis]|uniref:Type II secretion system protein n=1 Tax=Candidatus Nitronauta litoralis TaxID=2705533 RepID=A0A7T0G139_9BACT|nr:MAG: type II secretion system protein [Candidatus Nitronauta litoralis]
MKNHIANPDRALSLSRQESGFTLIELLLTVTVMVAIAFTVTGTFIGVDQDARAQLTRVEMQEVAAAIRQFRQDTGYYPKQGLFNHVADGGSIDLDPGNDPDPAVDISRFESPANLEQLYQEPTTDNDIPATTTGPCANCVMRWDPDTGRGWRGPYLKRESLVDVGDDLEEDGLGNPDTIATGPHLNVLGVADPQEQAPQFDGGADDCTENLANTACLLDWRPRAGDPSFLTHGRPFLYFIMSSADANVTGCNSPCVTAFGLNGRYDQGNDDDIVVSVN